MFARRQRRQSLLGVHVVGRADVDQVDRRVLDDVLPRGAVLFPLPAVGEGRQRDQIQADDGVHEWPQGDVKEATRLEIGVAVRASHKLLTEQRDVAGG